MGRVRDSGNGRDGKVEFEGFGLELDFGCEGEVQMRGRRRRGSHGSSGNRKKKKKKMKTRECEGRREKKPRTENETLQS